MSIKTDDERKQWRAEFATLLQELVPTAEQIFEIMTSRPDQENLWNDIDTVIGRTTETELCLDRLRIILKRWKSERNE